MNETTSFIEPNIPSHRVLINKQDWKYTGKWRDAGRVHCERCGNANCRYQAKLRNRQDPNYHLWVGTTCIGDFIPDCEYATAARDGRRYARRCLDNQAYLHVLRWLNHLAELDRYGQVVRDSLRYWQRYRKLSPCQAVWFFDALKEHPNALPNCDRPIVKVRLSTLREKVELYELDPQDGTDLFAALTTGQRAWLVLNRQTPSPAITAIIRTRDENIARSQAIRQRQLEAGLAKQRAIHAKRELESANRNESLPEIDYERQQLEAENYLFDLLIKRQAEYFVAAQRRLREKRQAAKEYLAQQKAELYRPYFQQKAKRERLAWQRAMMKENAKERERQWAATCKMLFDREVGRRHFLNQMGLWGEQKMTKAQIAKRYREEQNTTP